MSQLNPLNIPGLAVWLDASDSSNIAVNGSGKVTQWLDKSGNNYNVKIIGSPPFSNKSVTFDGTNSSYFQLQDGSIPYGDSPFSIYFVTSMADNQNRGLFSAGNTSAPNTPLTIRDTGSQSMFISAGISLDTYPRFLIPSYNNNFVYSAVYIKDTSITTFINGNLGAYGVSTVKRYQTNSPNYLGCWGPGVLPMKGSISEVLIFGTSHPPALRQQVEGYLAWKWSLNGSLNAKHPYLSSAPTASLKGSLGQGTLFSPTSLTTATGPPVIPQQILVAAGYTSNSGNVSLAYSYDGITWVPSNMTSLTKNCSRITYNGNMYIGSNAETGQLIYSYDGINWTSNPTATNSFGNVSDIAWSGTNWIITSKAIRESTTVYLSSDGFNWINAQVTYNIGFDNAAYNIKWINNRWVLIGAGGGNTQIRTSSNSTTWTYLRGISGTFSYDRITATTFIESNGNVILIGSYAINNFAPLQYSTDNLVTLVTSTTGSAIFTGGMYAAAWNGLMWVGVGAGTGSIATSTDGITWTAVPNSLSIFTKGSSVAWNGVRWVAGGLGPKSSAYSTDGITWTGTNNLFYTETLAICSTNILPYTQVGATTPITGTFPESILPLCEVWLDASDPLGTGSKPTFDQPMTVWSDKSGKCRNAVPYTYPPNAYGAFTVVAIAGSTTPPTTNYLYYSNDGITNWTACTTPITSTISSIAYNGTIWLASAQNAAIYLTYSTDGITWTAVSNGLPTGICGIAIGSIVWANSFWLICVSVPTGYNIYKSTDGLNWTLASANRQFHFLRFFKNKFYGVLQNSVSTSTDGVTWTSAGFNYNVPLGGGYAGITDLQWDGNIWISTHVWNGVTYPIYTSTDGINWTANESANSLYVYRGPYGGGASRLYTNSNGVWLAGLQNSGNANCIIYSNDGLTWSTIPSIQALGYNGCITITFNGTVFIATVGSSGAYGIKYITSPDGLTWTPIPTLEAVVPYTSGNPLYIQTMVTKTVLPVIKLPGLSITSNVLNGMSVADATFGTMRIPYKDFPVDGFTIMAVQYSNSTSSTSRLLSNYTGNLLFYGVNGASSKLAITNSTSYGSAFVPNVNTANKWILTGFTSDATTGKPYVSGSQLNTIAGTNGLTFNDIIIGTDGGGSQIWNGYIAEILIFSTILTNDQRQEIEGYLSWKWGLSDNLPSGHKYQLLGLSDIPYSIASFRPNNVISLISWYDATDPLNTGTAPTNGTIVTTWNDKSGNNWNLGQNGGLPTFKRGIINSLPALDFTNGSCIFIPGIQRSSNITLLWVGIIKPTISNTGVLFWHGNSTIDAVLQKVPGTSSIGWYTNSVATSVPVSYNAPVMFSCTMQNGTNMFIQKTDLSGTISNSSVQTYSSTPGSVANLNVAGTSSGVSIINSYIGEILYYHEYLPASQRQLLEGYLAWKWKLNDYLPPTNPYYYVDPNSNLAPICFIQGAHVETDQAVIEIEKIDPNYHTIGGKKIVAVTKTPGDKMSLVLIRRGLIGRNVPFRDTPITVSHKVLYNNQMIQSLFVPGAVPYSFTEDFLYNVLLKTHERMKVNGMVVETLSPSHPTAKIFLASYKG